MAIQQIKAYLELQSLPQLTQFKGVSGDQVLRAYQLTSRLKENILRLVAFLTEVGGPPCIIAGPRGAGKSHLMAVLRSLVISPVQASILREPSITLAVRKLIDERFFVIDLDFIGDQPPNLLSLLRDELANREIRFEDHEWEESLLGERLFRTIQGKLPTGTTLVLFIDGISNVMRLGRQSQMQMINLLNWAAKNFSEPGQKMIVTLDDDRLSDIAVRLSNKFRIERLELANLREIADRFIFKKNEIQRRELSIIYNDMIRLMPQFSWSREDLIALFPVHPVVLEVVPGLRLYSRSFSYFGFITTVASRAMNRRATNLASLDELFDSFEFDLRKNERLAAVFNAYDRLTMECLSALNLDDRLWAKLALKALFVFSLAGQWVSPTRLGDAVLLYDERDLQGRTTRIRNIIDFFVRTIPSAFELREDRDSRTYRLIVEESASNSARKVIEESIALIPNDAPELGELLVTLGGPHFADWPLEGDKIRTEMALSWRGTLRSGIIKLGQESELEIVLPPDHSESIAFDDSAESLVDDELLPIIDELVDNVAEAATGHMPINRVCEWDWQISVLSIQARILTELPAFLPPTLFYWVPAAPSEEEVISIKQMLVLRRQKEELVKHGLNFTEEQEKCKQKLREIFRRIYIESGQLHCPGTGKNLGVMEIAGLQFTIMEVVNEVVAEGLGQRYPDHPDFATLLSEKDVLLLAREFWGRANLGGPEVQRAARNCAQPLGLTESVGGRLYPRLQPKHRVIEKASQVFSKENLTPLHDIYRALRAEPLGLQDLPQKLILLAYIADWQIELVGDRSSKVLSAANLATLEDLKPYYRLRKSTLPYTMVVIQEWYQLLTSGEKELDLVSPIGRQKIIENLNQWRQKWIKMGFAARVEKVHSDVLTTRLSQIVANSERYFDVIAGDIERLNNKEIALEDCLVNIIDSFGAKTRIFHKLQADIKILEDFLEWLPSYLETKSYALAAECLPDEVLTEKHNELIEILRYPQGLFEAEKRQRYDEVFQSFKAHYINCYTQLHDQVMQQQVNLDELMLGSSWRTLELISQLVIANSSYYRLGREIVQRIRASYCRLVVKDLLQIRPHCVCSFRVSRRTGVNTLLQILDLTIKQGLNYHRRLLEQYEVQLESAPLEDQELLKSILRVEQLEDAAITLTTVENLNRVLMRAKPSLGLLPAVRLNGKTNKEELRENFERWLRTLPAQPGVTLDFGFGVSDIAVETVNDNNEQSNGE